MYSLVSEEYAFAAACLTFIVTGVVCGRVRWKHMCRPFDENTGYFYPARKLVSFFYCAAVLEFPYILNPSDPEIWAYMRIFGITFFPICFATIFERYFRTIKENSTLWKIYFHLPVLLIFAMLVSLATGHAGWMTSRTGMVLTGMFGAALTGALIRTLLWLRKEIDEFHKDNFSSDDDFPYRFAERILWGPAVWVAVTWLIFITGSRWLKLAADLVSSWCMVDILCTILHPQRMTGDEDTPGLTHRWNRVEMLGRMTPEPDAGDSAQDASGTGGTADNEEIRLDAVRTEVNAIVTRRYREPHLRKSDILEEIGGINAALASRYISQTGYYNLVNMFRLRHAELYRAAHPEASLEDTAAASGFTSPSAYSKAARSIRAIDFDLVKGVKI